MWDVACDDCLSSGIVWFALNEMNEVDSKENKKVGGCIARFEVESLSRMGGWEGDVGFGESMEGLGGEEAEQRVELVLDFAVEERETS